MIVSLGCSLRAARHGSNFGISQFVVVAQIESQLLFVWQRQDGFLQLHRHLVGVVEIIVGKKGDAIVEREHVGFALVEHSQRFACGNSEEPASQGVAAFALAKVAKHAHKGFLCGILRYGKKFTFKEIMGWVKM